MSQATKSRPAADEALRAPRIGVNLSIVGVILTLAAWLLQSYFTTLQSAAAERKEAVRFATLQRQMWLIEYNSSLVRVPRNERVTARAAFHVIENTRQLLALSEPARPAAEGETEAERVPENHDELIAAARTQLAERDHASLIRSLNELNRAFEERVAEGTIAQAGAVSRIPWWQHAFPAVFLVGIVFCLMGARRRAAAADDEI